MLNPASSARWNKIEIMIRLGLRHLDEVEKSIHRFRRNDLSSLAQYCKEQLKYGMTIIIIAVPHEYENSLPNFIISSNEKFEVFLKQEERILDKRYIELWCCPQTKRGKKYFGRFLIEPHFPDGPILFEVVWAASARTIDLYDGEGDYLLGIFSLDGEESRIIKQTQQELPAELFESNIEIIKKKLYEKMPQILSFTEVLKSIDIVSLCIEFSYDDGHLDFIDFDTENNEKVIEYYNGRNDI